MEVNYDLDGYTLTSLTAGRTINRHYGTPIGASIIPKQLFSYNYYAGDQVQQEFPRDLAEGPAAPVRGRTILL